MKYLLLFLAFSSSGCLSVPKQYVGEYALGNEILTITENSVTLSQGGTTLADCRQVFQPDSLFDSAIKGASGVYIVPHYYLTDGHVTEDDRFLIDYPVGGKFDVSYVDEEGLTAHLVRSDHLVDVTCFNSFGSPTFTQNTYRTKGYSFSFQVDLAVDRVVEFISVTENPTSELDAVEEDSGYQVPFEGFKGSYTSFRIDPQQFMQFNRVGRY